MNQPEEVLRVVTREKSVTAVQIVSQEQVGTGVTHYRPFLLF